MGEDCTVLVIEKHQMIRVLHEEHEFSDRFIAHMLAPEYKRPCRPALQLQRETAGAYSSARALRRARRPSKDAS
jgi:hypothetical protein